MAARVATLANQQHEREINGDLSISMFLTLIATPVHSSIVYLDFMVNSFHIRVNWINLLSNILKFYGLPHENSHTNFQISQELSFSKVNDDTIMLRLFSYILRDAALE